ncbi:hypothetical protein [Streptomyces durhamensis]
MAALERVAAGGTVLDPEVVFAELGLPPSETGRHRRVLAVLRYLESTRAA